MPEVVSHNPGTDVSSLLRLQQDRPVLQQSRQNLQSKHLLSGKSQFGTRSVVGVANGHQYCGHEVSGRSRILEY